MKLALSITLALALSAAAVAQQGSSMTPSALQKALAARPMAADAERLAGEIRGYFGPANLTNGSSPKIEGTTVAWALEAPGAAATPKVVSEDGKYSLALARVGSTDVYAAVA